MKKLWKCTVCGYTMEGEEAPENCPRCGSPREKYVQLEENAAKKIYDSYRTNDIYISLVVLAEEMIHLSNEEIEINLDPNCLRNFQKTGAMGFVIKEMAKAEMAGHVAKGKW